MKNKLIIILLCVTILGLLVSATSCGEDVEEIQKYDFESSFFNNEESNEQEEGEHQESNSSQSVDDAKESESQTTAETITNSGVDTNTDYDENLSPN